MVLVCVQFIIDDSIDKSSISSYNSETGVSEDLELYQHDRLFNLEETVMSLLQLSELF